MAALSGQSAGELMAAATKEFGDAGQNLFGTLLQKAKKDKDEEQRLEAKAAGADLRYQYGLLEMKVAATGLVEGDKDGTLTAAKFREHANNLKNKTMERYKGDKIMQLRIADHSDEALQENFLKSFAGATKNIEIQKQQKDQEWLGSMVKEIETRPENVGLVMARSELDIEQSSIPEAKKPLAILERNAVLANAVAQSYINKGNLDTENPAKWFERGAKMVSTLSPKVTPAEMEKIQKNINEQKNFRVRAVNDEFDRKERVERREKEDLKNKMESDYYNRINERPFDEDHKNRAIADMMKNPLFRGDPDAIKRMQNINLNASGLADDRAETEFQYLVAQGKTGQEMVKFVQSKYDTNNLPSQRISSDRAAKLMNMANHMNDSEKNSPQTALLRKSLMDYITNMGKERYPNDKAMQAALSRASVNYLQMEINLAKGGKPTPKLMVQAANTVIEQATNGAIKDDLPTTVKSPKDIKDLGTPPKQRNNVDKMDKATEEGAKNFLKNKDNMSDEELKKTLEYLKSKKDRRDKISGYDPSTAEKAQPNAPQFKVFNK